MTRENMPSATAFGSLLFWAFQNLTRATLRSYFVFWYIILRQQRSFEYMQKTHSIRLPNDVMQLQFLGSSPQKNCKGAKGH